MRDEQGDIYLYKRGSSGFRNAGLEPYCEALASELARKIMGNETVPYQLVRLHKELASKCPLFSDERYGYTPVAKFGINHSSPEALMAFYSRIGSEDMFRKMLVLDALTFNVDRHAGNHGVLVENDTQKPVRMAPVFDLNLSMLPYIEDADMERIGDKMEEYGPRIGDDFTRMGQLAMTSEIRSALVSLKGFEFRGDDHFTEKRIKFMEKLVNRQIEALLSRDVLYTHDVFVPETQHAKTEPPEPDKYEILAAKLWEEYGFQAYFSAYEMGEDSETNRMVLYLKGSPNKEIHLDLNEGLAGAYIDGYEADVFDLVANQTKLSEALDAVKAAYEKEMPAHREKENILER